MYCMLVQNSIINLCLSLSLSIIPLWVLFDLGHSAEFQTQKGEEAFSAGDFVTPLEEWIALGKQGDEVAQLRIATIYRNGKGVPKDYKKAVEWFILAANKGNAEAQYNLGIMYNFGLGVIPDYEKALKWYTLSAEQGNKLAQYNLGRLYYLGTGVSENRVYAHMWLTLASSARFEMAKNLLGLLSETMNLSQKKEAQQLVLKCLNKNFKVCTKH